MLVKGIIGSAGALSLEWGSYLSIFEAPNATIELYGRFKYPFLICLILSTIVSIFTIFEYFIIVKNKVDNMRNGIQVSQNLIVGRERRSSRTCEGGSQGRREKSDESESGGAKGSDGQG